MVWVGAILMLCVECVVFDMPKVANRFSDGAQTNANVLLLGQTISLNAALHNDRYIEICWII